MNVLVLITVALFCVATRVAGDRRARYVEASRPRPDYRQIAAMEREVYGEVFHHDGAPGASGIVRVPDLDAYLGARLCRNCGDRSTLEFRPVLVVHPDTTYAWEYRCTACGATGDPEPAAIARTPGNRADTRS